MFGIGYSSDGGVKLIEVLRVEFILEYLLYRSAGEKGEEDTLVEYSLGGRLTW